MKALIKALTKLSDDALAEEGLTKEIINYVDLDVAFSPVICFRGETLNDAITVSESTDSNRYLLRHPLIPEGFVSKDRLQVMRARFLLARQGPPNPEPIATFHTDTKEGIESAKQFFTMLGLSEQLKNKP